MKLAKIIFVSAVISVCAVGQSEASTITCPTTGTFDRQATVSNVLSCTTMGPVTGTPNATDVHSVFGGTWIEVGALALANGTDGWLTGNVTSGSWGALPVSGNYGIDPILWANHSHAVLTFHLGNGGGDPDWFFFELVPGTTSGTFDIQRLSGSGGGFSNIFLWTDAVGTCTPDGGDCAAVPEPGSLLLFGSGLAGLAMFLRKRASRKTT